MDNLTLRNASLSFARALSKPTAQQKPAAQPSPVELDPEVAKRLKEAREKAAEIVKTLDSSKIDVAKQRKAAAKERLDRVRESLRTLKMVAGDPKTMAREGARLARELGAAVKEYAAAGGSDGGAAPAVGGASAGGEEAKAKDAQTDGAAAPAAGEGAAATPDAEAAPAATAESAAAGAEKGELTKADAEAAAAKASGDEATQTDAAKKDGATDGKDEKDADGNFADEARSLAKKLKVFLNKQKERLKSEAVANSANPADAEREVMGALNDVRQTENVLGGMPTNGGVDPLASVDIQV